MTKERCGQRFHSIEVKTRGQVREIQRERNKGEAHTGFQLDALFNEKEGRYTNELYLLRQW